MPFALDEYDRAYQRFIGDAMHELAIAQDELLGQIEIAESPGALGSVFQDEQGEDVGLEPSAVDAKFTMDINAVREGHIEALVIEIDQAARQFRDGFVASIISTLQTVTDATGNVVNAAGKTTFEAFYETLEKIEWSLTDDDELSMPSVLINPKTLASLPPETEEQRAQIEQLKQRKLRDLLARRRRRRLS